MFAYGLYYGVALTYKNVFYKEDSCQELGRQKEITFLSYPHMPKMFILYNKNFLGLIHANHGGTPVIHYLSDQLTRASTSVVRHGACLGLGLAALGTRDMGVYEHLRDTLYQNEAVSGEAAGTAMGLVMAGSMNNDVFF